MPDSTRESDAILRQAGRSLAVQREGGFHRRSGRRSPIGRGSAQVRWANLKKRIKLMLAAVFAILLTASVAGLVVGGLGFSGMMLTVLAIVAAVFIFGNFPKVKVPRRADLNRGDVRQLVTRTELWLEHQRPALPAPAARIVEDIGVQLDALGLQLEHVDPAHPAAAETRKLVGEYLPETIDSYRRIPEKLRKEERAGATPDRQLEESLRKISGEIDHVTRQLADGALDDLAIRTRYLDYKFGGELDGPPELPAPDPLAQSAGVPLAAATRATAASSLPETK
jgi:hypothetical protein